jgi:hypothetical protein
VIVSTQQPVEEAVFSGSHEPTVGIFPDVGGGGPPVRRHRTSSCPPGRVLSVTSGPWSREWLQDHNHGDAGLIFSTKKKLRKGKRLHEGHKELPDKVYHKKKVGGVLRHTMQNLKKVARLPGKDCKEVLKVL